MAKELDTSLALHLQMLLNNSYGRFDYHRKKMLKESSLRVKGLTIISDMEEFADKVDNKDSEVEGSSYISSSYASLGRPYEGLCHIFYLHLSVYRAPS